MIQDPHLLNLRKLNYNDYIVDEMKYKYITFQKK